MSPTRFFVQEKVYDKFVSQFVDIAKNTKVGDGLEADSKMGPLANPRRINAIEGFIADAQDKGAKVATGGKRIGNQGNFFQPTVLTDVPDNARIMNEEPFGPHRRDAALQGDGRRAGPRQQARPSASPATPSPRTPTPPTKVADALESGMVTINHFGIALPETPFGGVKDSGFGHEGGIEGLQVYMQPKLISHMG